MGMARRDFGNGDALQLRAMLSPDPLMGASGYPLLFQTGETADGVTPLVDRQHPHDLFMELSASYSHRLSGADSVFVYAGLPGEPAFGPPAFMHRMSAMDSPEAPITHHWLDSDHITFGVVTGGWVHGDWKIEASRFRGREPDQHRYDIETGALEFHRGARQLEPDAELGAASLVGGRDEPRSNSTPTKTKRAGRPAPSTRSRSANTAGGRRPAPSGASSAATASRSTPGSPRPRCIPTEAGPFSRARKRSRPTNSRRASIGSRA